MIYYITFGIGTALKHHIQPIEAKTEESARAIAWDTFENWAFIYDEIEGKRIAKKYNLTVMPIIKESADYE